MHGPQKIEDAWLQEFNSKSFEFNSNGLNKDLVLEVSKNVRIFGGAPEYDERI